jgi:N-methylhydantoinase A
MKRAFSIGVDIGGTFTDIVLHDASTGEVRCGKVPSTPDDFSRGVSAAVTHVLRADLGPRVARFAHGTTVATNTALEGKGARVGLITTQGFRDVLEIGRQDRLDPYDLMYERPRPLVARHLRIGVRERVAADGSVLTPLQAGDVEEAVRRLLDEQVDVMAVCFLHSYANGRHEEQVAELAHDLAPDVPVTLSSALLPEFREYERMVTTAMNAYVMPVTDGYLSRLQDAVAGQGVKVPIQVMQSNGGLLDSAAAGRHAAGALISGPAAGVMGAISVAAAAGCRDVITFDMGGTSTDVSLIAGGRPRVVTGRRLAGHPIQLPMLDIHTVGAGGGSIARMQGSALKVGPESAGASPGPACYGRGGSQPTVSDAQAALGRLSTGRFLHNRAVLDLGAARHAIESRVAEPLELSGERAAAGILAVADNHMMHAIRAVSVERGIDPRDFVLVAFGGAGPLHASSLARLLGIRRVLVPRIPGALSALGLLMTDARRDYVRTRLTRLEELDVGELESGYQQLEREGRRHLEGEGFDADDVWSTRSADLRYRGQAYELPIDVPVGLDSSAAALISERFRLEHQQLYGHAEPGEPIDIVNIRAQVWGRVPKPALAELDVATGTPEIGRRTVWIDGSAGAAVDVYDRGLLSPGRRLEGPAVLEQMDCTTLLMPGDLAEIDRFGNVLVTVGAA